MLPTPAEPAMAGVMTPAIPRFPEIPEDPPVAPMVAPVPS